MTNQPIGTVCYVQHNYVIEERLGIKIDEVVSKDE